MRLQISVSETMGEKIEKYSEEFGVSKSAFCSMLLGQSIMGLDGAKEALTSVGLSMVKEEKENKK